MVYTCHPKVRSRYQVLFMLSFVHVPGSAWRESKPTVYGGGGGRDDVLRSERAFLHKIRPGSAELPAGLLCFSAKGYENVKLFGGIFMESASHNVLLWLSVRQRATVSDSTRCHCGT